MQEILTAIGVRDVLSPESVEIADKKLFGDFHISEAKSNVRDIYLPTNVPSDTPTFQHGVADKHDTGIHSLQIGLTQCVSC
ncbi:unnamed protein product [Ceratitis capitata]|uniref:(Mediterranean fruit fly) hypothetical protein n=1 Tax=Ceratitis capitata TaxID=7213 RepID=A0A811U2X2_CERCA|nr:unnamed protein product [Ceratitis capitata]